MGILKAVPGNLGCSGDWGYTDQRSDGDTESFTLTSWATALYIVTQTNDPMGILKESLYHL